MRDFLSGRIRSFGFAFQGVGTMLRSQRNAWLHALATVAVVTAGLSLFNDGVVSKLCRELCRFIIVIVILIEYVVRERERREPFGLESV